VLTNLTLFFMTTILNYENSSTVLYRFSMRIPHHLMGGSYAITSHGSQGSPLDRSQVVW